MRVPTLVLIVALVLAAAPTGAQVEIDRTLQRVYGTPIMASDVRQVRLLKLMGAGSDSESAVLTALENRALMLREVSRGAAADPTDVEIAARRQAWWASWPAGTDVPALMARAGMNQQGLDGWFRDDLQIEAYLDQRFGPAAATKRSTRIADWVRDLRQRANLNVKHL